MGECKFITYAGREILFADHVGLRGEALLQSLQQATQKAIEAPQNDLLLLADYTDTYVNDEIMAYLTGEESKQVAKKARKIAVVGVTGIKKIFLNTYNLVTGSGTRAFNDLESAKQYLVS
jgi:hypothetical protein